MCLAAVNASFANTKGFVHQTRNGVQVLGYQNSFSSFANGPDAMLLPVFASIPLNSGSLVPLNGCDWIIEDMDLSTQPRNRSIAIPGSKSRDLFEVVEYGAYHVVLTQNAYTFEKALDQVPVERRPKIGSAMMRFCQEKFGHRDVSFVLCCFNASQMRQMANSQPVVLAYWPSDPEMLRFPAWDGHRGDQMPKAGELVERDHRIFWSVEGMYGGQQVDYREPLPGELRKFIPRKVHATEVKDMTLNGDFGLRVQYVHDSMHVKPSRIQILD